MVNPTANATTWRRVSGSTGARTGSRRAATAGSPTHPSPSEASVIPSWVTARCYLGPPSLPGSNRRGRPSSARIHRSPRRDHAKSRHRIGRVSPQAPVPVLAVLQRVRVSSQPPHGARRRLHHPSLSCCRTVLPNVRARTAVDPSAVRGTDSVCDDTRLPVVLAHRGDFPVEVEHLVDGGHRRPDRVLDGEHDIPWLFGVLSEERQIVRPVRNDVGPVTGFSGWNCLVMNGIIAGMQVTSSSISGTVRSTEVVTEFLRISRRCSRTSASPRSSLPDPGTARSPRMPSVVRLVRDVWLSGDDGEDGRDEEERQYDLPRAYRRCGRTSRRCRA